MIGDLLHDCAHHADALANVAAGYPVAVAQGTGGPVEHMANELGMPFNLEGLERLLADAASTFV